jgi:hypothetical protein
VEASAIKALLLTRCQTRAQSLNLDRYQVLGALPTQDARTLHFYSLGLYASSLRICADLGVFEYPSTPAI